MTEQASIMNNRLLSLQVEDQTYTPNERLLFLAAEGNKRAFGRLYEQYLEEIYRYIFYKVGDPLEAEDLTEDVFLKTWEHLPKIVAKGSRIENFRAWIYRTAHNRVIDFFRSKKPLPLKEDLLLIDEMDPEEITEDAFTSRRLVKAIRQLDDKYQEIIILRFINQLSHKEAALAMNLSDKNTRVLQHRALKKLQSILVTV